MDIHTDTVQARLRGVAIHPNSCEAFLEAGGKIIACRTTAEQAQALQLCVGSVKQGLPPLYTLMTQLFRGVGISLVYAVLSHYHKGALSARMVLAMYNEVATKLVELEAHPADAIVLALVEKVPIYITRTVLAQMPDAREKMQTWLAKSV